MSSLPAVRIRRFFEFSQNNSGGRFHESPSEGITTCVIIEANDWNHANERAIDIGLYFNGCDTGRDCSCCGDRWYKLWDEEGDTVPSSYGKPVWGHAANPYQKGAYIHYLDGTIEHVTFREGTKKNSFFSDEYFEDAIPENWRTFQQVLGAKPGGEDESRGVVIVKLRKMVALAKDQKGKPEGETARRIAEELAAKYDINIGSWA